MPDKKEIEKLKKEHEKEMEILDNELVRLKDEARKAWQEVAELKKYPVKIEKLKTEIIKIRDEAERKLKKEVEKPPSSGEEWKKRIR